jgi:diguanylate cyclase (GGDEF)-like protein
MIRERLRDPQAEFVPHGQASEVATAAFSGAQCPVAFGQGEGSATYGLLRSARGSLADVTAQAAWLAGWLRLRDQQAQLREAAFTDPLTGAWNRRYFDRFMANALDHARSHRHFLTVFVFDLDNFKKYNDQFGHEAGDEILRQTVQLLRSVVRPTDRVCRLGGDEFVVIFDEPEGSRQEGSRHPTSVAELAKRFQRQLAAHRFPQLSQVPPGSLTISGGLATFPWDGSTADALLQSADRLLIQSKRQGKNVIELGGPGGA